MNNLKELRDNLSNQLSEAKGRLVKTLQDNEISIDTFRKQSIEVNELIVQINLIDVLITVHSDLEDIKNVASVIDDTEMNNKILAMGNLYEKFVGELQ